MIASLEALARKLGAVSIDARRPGRDPHWHKRWRARLTLANGRATTAWGDTLMGAVTALVERVEFERYTAEEFHRVTCANAKGGTICLIGGSK